MSVFGLYRAHESASGTSVLLRDLLSVVSSKYMSGHESMVLVIPSQDSSPPKALEYSRWSLDVS